VNLAAGLALAKELSAKGKDDVRLHFTLGVLLASAKQYREAQVELEKANALQPETFEILYNLGQADLRGHDDSKAGVVLNRALKLKPDSAETLYLLAQVYVDQSRSVDALDPCRTAESYSRRIDRRHLLSGRATVVVIGNPICLASKLESGDAFAL